MMRIYLDDDLDSNLLIGLLRQEGHEVISPRTAGTRGINDEEHLDFAVSRNAVLLTANALDFVLLHNEFISQQRKHAGILIVYRENNPSRDMSFRQIAKSVSRIEESGVPLANAFHNLNFWR
jgi:predicted nuclease of predicted toxin-antitoxin system